MEGDQASIRIIETGKSPALRHLGRTHRVDTALLHEAAVLGQMDMIYCHTDYQCADIFTKAFSVSVKFWHVRCIIGHVRPDDFWKRVSGARTLITTSSALPSLEAMTGAMNVTKAGGADGANPSEPDREIIELL